MAPEPIHRPPMKLDVVGLSGPVPRLSDVPATGTSQPARRIAHADAAPPLQAATAFAPNVVAERRQGLRDSLAMGFPEGLFAYEKLGLTKDTGRDFFLDLLTDGIMRLPWDQQEGVVGEAFQKLLDGAPYGDMLRHMVERMGPAWVKFMQLLSVRADVVLDKDLRADLRKACWASIVQGYGETPAFADTAAVVSRERYRARPTGSNAAPPSLSASIHSLASSA